MLVCNQCNNEQETGKFCGACGGSLQLDDGETPASQPVQQTTAAAATTTAQPQTQQTTETIKNGLSEYWNYFLNLIKNPTRAFQLDESHFINGLINIALFAVAFSLSVYFYVNSLAKKAVSTTAGLFGVSDVSTAAVSLPFFSINSRLVFIMALYLLVSFGSAFVITKIGKSDDSFKTFLSQYGGLTVPFAALNIIAILTGLMGIDLLTVFLLGLSGTITLVFVPVLYVFEKLSALNVNGQRVYLSLSTLVLISIGSAIVGLMMVVNFLSDISRVSPF